MITLHLNQLNNLDDVLSSYNSEEPIKIFLAEGIYHLKLTISRNNLHFIGIPNKTVITNSDYAFKLHQDGLLYNTFRSQTVLITGSNVVFENITIKNDAGRGDRIGQSIALSVFGNHNRFINCDLISNQDTLFIGPLPKELSVRYDHILSIDEQTTSVGQHYFQGCRISGDVDYVFGSGTALFESCTFISSESGYVFAPSTFEETPYGFISYQSTFKSTSDTYKVILGRPWRDFGKVHLIDNTFLSPVEPNRFDDWSKNEYFFFESPYVNSPYSIPVSDDLMTKLLKFIEEIR